MTCAYRIVYDPNNQAAARAGGYVFIVPELRLGDFKSVSTGTRVMINFFDIVPCHVFDLYFVVVSSHGSLAGGERRWW